MLEGQHVNLILIWHLNICFQFPEEKRACAPMRLYVCVSVWVDGGSFVGVMNPGLFRAESSHLSWPLKEGLDVRNDDS